MDNENEIWLPIKDYEGFYEVSNTGFIRSFGKNGRKGKVLSLCYDGAYYAVMLCKNAIQTKHRIHRVVGLRIKFKNGNRKIRRLNPYYRI